MRQIEPKEVELIEFLAKAAGVCLSLYEKQPVWVVNPQMKSLRADYCPKGCRVFALISYQFDDLDNVPVVVLARFLTDEAKSFLKDKAGNKYLGIEEAENGSNVYSSSSPDGEFIDEPGLWSLERFNELVT